MESHLCRATTSLGSGPHLRAVMSSQHASDLFPHAVLLDVTAFGCHAITAYKGVVSSSGRVTKVTYTEAHVLF
eukprot:COSAG01_NODE_4467_length_5006_cov_83.048367_2_plen_73_part_00